MIAASSSNTHSSRAPIVLATPRRLVNVHSRANARYVTNRKMLDAQHRCALAFHRLVTGSQIRLAITPLPPPTTKLCSEALSSFSTPATPPAPARARGTAPPGGGPAPGRRPRGPPGAGAETAARSRAPPPPPRLAGGPPASPPLRDFFVFLRASPPREKAKKPHPRRSPCSRQ